MDAAKSWIKNTWVAACGHAAYKFPWKMTNIALVHHPVNRNNFGR